MLVAPFHLALPINNIEEARQFYIEILGCTPGRSAKHWLDVNFWGHQLSLHVAEEECKNVSTNNVDHDEVPVRHFGVILPWDEWHKIKEVLLNGEYASEIQWVIRPKIRFKGEVGEQATMFIKDPSENVLEFKSFQNTHQIFASS
jgi:uncharacterized protein